MAQVVQGSKVWLRQRAEVITASECAAFEKKHKYQKPEDVVRAKVRALAGAETEFKINDAVKHGQYMEPHIIKWYEEKEDVQVDATGLCIHPEYPFLGASSDGLVDLDGKIEIKAPYYAKAPYSVFDADKTMYLWQVYMNLEVYDREWCDFICYLAKDEHVEPQFSIERVYRQEGWLDQEVSAQLLPNPRDGKISRVALFQSWHNYIHDQHQQPDLCKVHLDPPKDKSFKEVLDDPKLDRMAQLQERISVIRGRCEDDLTSLKELTDELEGLKKEVAANYLESVTNNRISIKFTKTTPPVDYKKIFEHLDGTKLLEAKGESIEDFRKNQQGYTSKIVEVTHGK